MTPATLDVLWAWDEGVEVPKFKMVVCVEPDEGWFLRINTRDHFRPCVRVFKRDNRFLAHDSYVECTLETYDEWAIEEGQERGGIVGRLHASALPAISGHLQASAVISDRDKRQLAVVLKHWLP